MAARKGPKKVNRYTLEMKRTAVRLSNAPGAFVKDVAQAWSRRQLSCWPISGGNCVQQARVPWQQVVVVTGQSTAPCSHEAPHGSSFQSTESFTQ